MNTECPAPPSHLVDLTNRHFRIVDGELFVGDFSVSELVTEFGSPLFVYSTEALERQRLALQEALPPQFDLYYSVKANPNQAILQHFVSRGCGLEIASAGELHQALAAGCPASKILFAGPGKSEQELALALEREIGEIHVESLTEARRIAFLSQDRLSRPVPIALRVNPSAAVEGGSMRMGAKPVPFGIDEDQLGEVVNQILQLPQLQIVGLHLFVGTQILDAQVLLTQYRAGIEIARKLSALLSRPLTTVDFGGGLGVPYFGHEHRLDLATLKVGLHQLVSELQDDPVLAETRFVVEPGRFLVAESGIYIARVLDVKSSRGKTFVITDGGMHHHLAASGNLGQTIKRNFPVAVLNRLDEPAAQSVDIVGPLCTPLDVLARNLEVPPVVVGDLIGVFQSGAYARAASPLGFLSHPAPAEVLVEGSSARLIRRRGNAEDYLADQEISDFALLREQGESTHGR